MIEFDWSDRNLYLAGKKCLTVVTQHLGFPIFLWTAPCYPSAFTRSVASALKLYLCTLASLWAERLMWSCVTATAIPRISHLIFCNSWTNHCHTTAPCCCHSTGTSTHALRQLSEGIPSRWSCLCCVWRNRRWRNQAFGYINAVNYHFFWLVNNRSNILFKHLLTAIT